MVILFNEVVILNLDEIVKLFRFVCVVLCCFGLVGFFIKRNFRGDLVGSRLKWRSLGEFVRVWLKFIDLV